MRMSPGRGLSTRRPHSRMAARCLPASRTSAACAYSAIADALGGVFSHGAQLIQLFGALAALQLELYAGTKDMAARLGHPGLLFVCLNTSDESIPSAAAHLRRQEAGCVDRAGPQPSPQGVALRPVRQLAVLAHVAALNRL